jgi:hypothetical protein
MDALEGAEPTKPQCGGGGTGGLEYDLPLHVTGLCGLHRVTTLRCH